ncbi:TIGR04283 family arsenosugar biosynthesis glycosyltransferase [Ascidiimonas sp. W6]|uniref:TIGR04283 family arsenosugar biosynthesis glycosyltransferase n=1 Tax=Ascidiimonas meishanensis TaxID=3128903 RepID=UPI0030EEB033
MKISIIIPALNEADNLSVLIPYLIKNSNTGNIAEIIISDGDSSDGSSNLFQNVPGVVFLSSKQGRAIQMNHGAREASAEVLYFLHADSFPPKQFDIKILQKIQEGREAGCFRLKFDYKHPFLLISQWCTRWNFAICRGGDQSLFITKALFFKMNGFNENYTIYEDNEFTNRLYKERNFTVLPDYVKTSARKYRKLGVYKLQYHFAVIHFKKLTGASPDALYKYYKKHIG